LPKNKPIRVGITGGIGSGKSLVAKIFSTLDVPVFIADFEAKRILASEEAVVSQVRKNFGEEAYRDGVPDRAFLAKAVFGDSIKRELLNSIIHPEVGKAFDRFCVMHNQAPYVVKEAAILVETGGHELLDFLILVTAPEELRISRVVNRDGADGNAIRQRISAQLSDEEKRIHADFEIINDDKNPVIPKVLQIHNAILRSARK
jgi:dephospho-CoA kinase